MALAAVSYERTVLLRKLSEIEKALEHLTAVRLYLNRQTVATAVMAIRARRAYVSRRRGANPAE